ncbi:hypothetical protein [Acinetobacter bereziniae]|uniref:hypothetical protein n=1 Tax=Acinetobacter bereziniae TaxID=106648 RepID=UPI002952D55E|nr:hypothetical protein [Acinetobacter bereziniae]MDV8155666.1 hypothetical protein [Acinetobacter bereziniae]
MLLLNSALVNASIGGWTLSNPTAVGASILYDGTKGSLTSSVLISPNASQVAKVLRGGIVGYAFTFAVEQLLGAVDWVLDPANNRIKYYPPADPNDLSTFPKIFEYPCLDKMFHTNIQAMEICVLADMEKRFPGYFVSSSANFTSAEQGIIKVYREDTTYNTYYFTYRSNPNYNPEKYLSLITAAEQVIENAESDNLDAQFAVLAAATNILSEAQQDDAKAKPIADELENNIDRDACEAQALADEEVCRSLPYQTNAQKQVRSRCWASVQERYGACTRSRPLPPLVTW